MKARLTNVSQVTKEGLLEVSFDLTDDKGAVLYPNLTVTDQPDNIETQIKNKADSLGAARAKAKQFTVGQELVLTQDSPVWPLK